MPVELFVACFDYVMLGNLPTGVIITTVEHIYRNWTQPLQQLVNMEAWTNILQEEHPAHGRVGAVSMFGADSRVY